MSQSLDTQHVRHYYEENTRLFLQLGQGTEGTIHRAIWGPGVKTRQQAMAYADSLIARRIRTQHEDPARDCHVVDLGCGVGASLCRLASSLSVRGTGVTISPAQVRLARARIAAAELSDSVRCVEGNFCNLPASIEPADLAFAIESFVHSPSLSDFFQQCSGLVREGGKLIVCDDFISDPAFEQQSGPRRLFDRFREGWVAPNLVDFATADRMAAQHGFEPVERIDLTPYLEMSRPRDWAIGALVRSVGWLPLRGSYFSMLRGGHAMQRCLKKGWAKHWFAVWQRRSNPA